MAAPETYTETTLAAFMVDTLGKVADVLDWRLLPDVQEAVNDALLLYGASTVEAARDIPKLRAFARVAVWRAAVASLSALYDFSDPEGNYSRSQVLAGAQRALARAEGEAGKWGGALTINVIPVRHVTDPYGLSVLGDEWGARP